MTDVAAQADQAWRQAQREWGDVREHWQGVTRDHYEQEVWTRFEDVNRRYLAALDSLTDALAVVARLPRP